MLQTTLVTYCSKMCIKTETIFLHSVSITSQYSPNNPTSNCPPQLGNLKLLSGSLLSVVSLSEGITMSNWTCGLWLVWATGSFKYRILHQTSTQEGKRLPKKVNVWLWHSLEWVNLNLKSWGSLKNVEGSLIEVNLNISSGQSFINEKIFGKMFTQL